MTLADYQELNDTTDMKQILATWAGIGEDDHGADTPARLLKMLDELTQCREADEEHITECIKWKGFDADGMRDMIVVEGIPFTSMCNHHLVPFLGIAHVAYIPEAQMAGLSKFARTVRHFSRQAQVQERLTKQIADFLEEQLKPQGVAVLLKAEHMCMTIRGVQAQGTKTTTSTMRGHFADHTRTAKAEFMQIIAGG